MMPYCSWWEHETWRKWFGSKDDFNFGGVEFEIPVGCVWRNAYEALEQTDSIRVRRAENRTRRGQHISPVDTWTKGRWARLRQLILCINSYDLLNTYMIVINTLTHKEKSLLLGYLFGVLVQNMWSAMSKDFSRFLSTRWFRKAWVNKGKYF